MRLLLVCLFLAGVQHLSAQFKLFTSDSSSFTVPRGFNLNMALRANGESSAASVDRVAYLWSHEGRKWDFTLMPDLSFGDRFLSYRPLNSHRNPKVQQNYYSYNEKVGFNASLVASYKIAQHSRLSGGVGSYSDAYGYRDLSLNQQVTSYPFFSYRYQGKRLAYHQVIALGWNRDVRPNSAILGGTQVDVFSAWKGMVHHQLQYKHGALKLAIFETVVWAVQDVNNTRWVDPLYSIPFVVIRPGEFQQGSSDNVLVGAKGKLSLGGYDLYSSLVLDEFLLAEIRSGRGWWANKWAMQFGVRKLWNGPLAQHRIRLEHNRVRPFTFNHNFAAQGYHHNGMSLGHPIGNNFTESLLRYVRQGEKSQLSFHFAYFQIHSREENLGGDVLASSNNRARDYGYYLNRAASDMYYLHIDYLLKPLVEKDWYVGPELGLRAQDAKTNYWLGLRLQYQLFTNTLAY